MAKSSALSAGGHLPTPLQHLLLQIIVGPESLALGRWREWQQQLNLDDIDSGSFRLLPMLHHRLRRLDAEGPEMSRYHGVARKIWYENKLTFHRIEKLLAAWQAEGREIGVLKGAALAHQIYPSPALRPMTDADLLVPLADAGSAIDWLLSHGWHNIYDRSRDHLVKYAVRKEHSADMCDVSGFAVDLHWQILNFPIPPAQIQEIWDAMVPVTIGRTTTRTLCPTDHLLHICAHGNEWNAVPPLRWVMDAHFLLKKHGADIDWERLVRLTRELHVAHFMSTSLGYLKTEFEEPIPGQVLAQIAQIPRLRWHQDEYRAFVSPDPHAMRDYSFRYRFHRMRATIPEWQNKSAWRATTDYLKVHWEFDSTFRLLFRVAERLVQKPWYWIRGRWDKLTDRLSRPSLA